ncbi:hypothetical protein D3C72_1999180 [compost metagenome]
MSSLRTVAYSVRHTPCGPSRQSRSQPWFMYSVSAQLGSAATPRLLATNCAMMGVSSALRMAAGSTSAGSRNAVKTSRRCLSTGYVMSVWSASWSGVTNLLPASGLDSDTASTNSYLNNGR